MKRKCFLTLLASVVLFVAVMPIAAAAPSDTPAPARPSGASLRPEQQPAAPVMVDQAVQRLGQDASGEVTFSYRAATGTVSFAAVSAGESLFPAGEGKTAEQQAMVFFTVYGAAFGLSDASSQLTDPTVVVDNYGTTHVSYTQVQQGVPVFGSFLKAHFDAAGRMTAANGASVPGIKISTTPELSAERAGAIAVQELNRQLADAAGNSQRSFDTRVLGTTLLVYRNGLLQDIPGSDSLVYEVEAGNGTSVREFFYIDAFDGHLVNQISGIEQSPESPLSLSRQISELSLATVKWTNPSDPDPIPSGWAGGTAQQIIDWNNEAAGGKESYNLFSSMAGRDSYNAAGATMRTVNNDPGISCPNATWNGTSTNYCTNVTTDDIVAHEWGHAYTEYTNNLIYQWQPGALNESFSDIWGELVDLINGRGTDAPGGLRAADGSACSTFRASAPGTDVTYRWLMGEDSTAFGGAIRDMWRPECYNDPGRVSSASYTCSTADGGGVHTNSGVPNHTFALLVDGGTYNGQTITAVGLTKAAHIFWRAQSTYLGLASGFPDLSSALAQSCTDLLGQNLNALSTSNATPTPSGQSITAADCTEVADASAATQLTTAPTQCNFQPLLNPTAPALCTTGLQVNTIWSEPFTGGLGAWTLARSFLNITPIDWTAATPPTPSPGSGGQAAFGADPNSGNCSGAAGDNTGVMQMTSPAIMIPANIITPRLTFNHWVASEASWDGGNLRISINGGAFNLVPQAAYTFNLPNRSLATGGQGNTNPLAGQRAFSGSDGGSVSGSWGQSQINLLTAGVAPGNTIRLRYDFGMDGCGGIVGWYVDDVTVYFCQGPNAVTLQALQAQSVPLWETLLTALRQAAR